MSIGNLKDSGNQGNNFPWQLKMLLGQQCACDQLTAINANTDQVESLLSSILTTLQASTEYEAKFVVDTCDSDKVYLEVRVWNPDTSTWGPITYYLPGNATPVTPVGASTPGCLKYTDPSAVLALILGAIQAGNVILQDIDNNTDGLETILTNINNNIVLIEDVIDNMTFTGGDLNVSANIQVGGTDVSNANPVPISDAGGSITVDGTVTANQGTSPWVVSGTVNIGTIPEVEIKNDVGNPVPVSGTVAATQSGTWNINNITGTVSLPTGAATETTLAAVNTKLTPTTRTHNTISATGAGSVPAGSLRGSVINVGSAVGTWNGISIPAGVAIPWDAVGPRDTYGAIAYNASGTTFIIEYTT